jgi:RNA polymerase primary sigma factor
MARLLGSETRSNQNPLETYLRDINETPLLNPEEVRQLAYRIEDGDQEARDHMVRANLRLVVNVARGYSGKGLCLPDLIEEGNLGLLRAVEAFDPSRGTRFSTYACYWIRQSMKRALINTSGTIRIPAYMSELLTKWRRASVKLQEELGRTPTEEEIGLSLKLSKRRLNILRKAIRIHGALPRSGDSDSCLSLNEMLTDTSTRTPDTGIAEADELRQVLGLLDRLNERSAAVLRLRFGLTGEEPCTLKDIGERLGLTRERVRQIECEALNQLRASLGAP